jgi:type I restriction enzyme S subunit
MGLRQFEIKLDELSKNETLRLWLPYVLPTIGYKYDKFNDYIELCESGSRPKGGINEVDTEKAISLGGEQINVDGSVDLSKTPYISYEYYDSVSKGKVKDNDILICKDGALTGKTCSADLSLFPSEKVMVNEHVFILRGNKKVVQRFLFYFTRSSIFQSQVKDLAYRKKAQPGLNLDHLKKIKIPAIPKTEQARIVKIIEPIEQKIKQLKLRIKEPQEIINQFFVKEFKIDLKRTGEEEQRKQFSVTTTFAFRNQNLRSSVRWHKIAPIQQMMYKNTKCIKKLGDYIVSTKNGWSPSCRESDTLNFVFGVNCISRNGAINFENMKFSDETCSNIDSYFAQNGDLFVSRGNTVDLVALASVVENIPENKDIIFPDLFIKLDVDQKILDKKYLAYLFNSIIGRYYFKYSAKGKNQTMVKISSDELNGFFLPVPKLDIQQRMVHEIKTELDAQEKIKANIGTEINKIDEIIENAIKNSEQGAAH